MEKRRRVVQNYRQRWDKDTYSIILKFLPLVDRHIMLAVAHWFAFIFPREGPLYLSHQSARSERLFTLRKWQCLTSRDYYCAARVTHANHCILRVHLCSGDGNERHLEFQKTLNRTVRKKAQQLLNPFSLTKVDDILTGHNIPQWLGEPTNRILGLSHTFGCNYTKWIRR